MENELDAPTTQQLSLGLLLAAAGGGLILGARPRGERPGRPFLTLAGMALIGVATHRSLASLLKTVGSRRRSADLHFSFVVDRPVEQVFAFCADFENFPRFIGALREVRDTGDGRSHWCASTPSGGTMEWNATTTKFVTNSVIGWRSVPGSPVDAVGLLRFSPEGATTCVKVMLCFRGIDSSFADTLAALVSPYRAQTLETEFRNLDAQLQLTAAPIPDVPAAAVATFA